jgi:hypothetical protein
MPTLYVLFHLLKKAISTAWVLLSFQFVESHFHANAVEPEPKSLRNFCFDQTFRCRRVYPKVFGLAACSENCKWYGSATSCSCIAILWVSLVSFAAITLYVASQRVFIVFCCLFHYDSVRKLLDTPSYCLTLTQHSVYFVTVYLRKQLKWFTRSRIIRPLPSI